MTKVSVKVELLVLWGRSLPANAPRLGNGQHRHLWFAARQGTGSNCGSTGHTFCHLMTEKCPMYEKRGNEVADGRVVAGSVRR